MHARLSEREGRESAAQGERKRDACGTRRTELTWPSSESSAGGMNLLLRKGVCPGGPALSQAAPPAAGATSATGDASLAACAALHQAQDSPTLAEFMDRTCALLLSEVILHEVSPEYSHKASDGGAQLC